MLRNAYHKPSDIPEEHDLLRKGHKVYVAGHPELIGRITEVFCESATLKLETGRIITLFKSGLRRKRK